EHVGEQGVARDVERQTEEDIGAALVELEVEPPVRDLRLKQAVAGLERHPRQVGGVPGGDDLAARGRIAPDELDEPGNLVDLPPVRPLPVPPLMAVDGTEIAGF